MTHRLFRSTLRVSDVRGLLATVRLAKCTEELNAVRKVNAPLYRWPLDCSMTRPSLMKIGLYMIAERMLRQTEMEIFWNVPDRFSETPRRQGECPLCSNDVAFRTSVSFPEKGIRLL